MRCWLLVLVAACSGPAKSASRPTLASDPPPPARPAPSAFAIEFAVPTTTPSGEPIKVAAFMPTPGLRRTRTITSEFMFDADVDGKPVRQRTTKRIAVKEEIVDAADETITKLKVDTITATEDMDLKGFVARKLFDGTFVITPNKSALQISAVPDRSVGDRELEELTYLYVDQVGVPYGPSVVIATKALRLGESIKLPNDDLHRLGADTDVTLTLVALDGNIATYQFLAVTSAPDDFTVDGVEHIGTKAQLAIEISTGRVIRSKLVDLRVVDKRSAKRTERTMELQYR